MLVHFQKHSENTQKREREKERERIITGTTTGLKERVCGHIGVSAMHGTVGDMRDPPAEMLYAVEPVGVLKIMPSA